MTPEEVAAWTRASRATQGLETPIPDSTVLARLVVLSDDEQAGGGPTATGRPAVVTDRQPSTLRRAARKAGEADG